MPTVAFCSSLSDSVCVCVHVHGRVCVHTHVGDCVINYYIAQLGGGGGGGGASYLFVLR